MVIFSVVWFLLIAAAAAFPTAMMRKGQQTNWWDYTYPFLGVVAWFALAMTGAGTTVSLSNFVAEVFWIAVVSVAIPWIRWFLSRYQNDQIRMWSLALTFLPIIVAVLIRLTMPTLPE